MPVLTREQIDKAADIRTEIVDVPEWGEGAQVIMTVMGSDDRDLWEESMTMMRGGTQVINHKQARAKLVAKCLVDEKGQRLYSDAEIGVLGKKSTAVLERLFVVAKRLNALDKKDIEALAKNSNAGPTEGSPSA